MISWHTTQPEKPVIFIFVPNNKSTTPLRLRDVSARSSTEKKSGKFLSNLYWTESLTQFSILQEHTSKTFR